MLCCFLTGHTLSGICDFPSDSVALKYKIATYGDIHKLDALKNEEEARAGVSQMTTLLFTYVYEGEIKTPQNHVNVLCL